MASTPEQLDTFAPVIWATPFLKSPDWCVRPRTRVAPSAADQTPDRFNRDTISSYDGMQQWLELYQKPAPGSKLITRSISLCKYGPGLMGFPTVCHGGAVLTMMDEALAFAMVANDMEAAGKNTTDWAATAQTMKAILDAGNPLEVALKDYMVTAHLDTKFLKPVRCPGVVGVEVTLVENKGHKMRFKGVMKDGEGTPLVIAEGLFIKVRGSAKI